MAPLSPSFAANKTVYASSVTNSTSSITVTPTEGQSDQTITVNGATVSSGSASSSIALGVGKNIISVVVAAEDGSQNTYTLVIHRTRATQSSHASLSALSLSSGTLSPSFGSDHTVYTADVTNSTSSIKVTPTEGQSDQTIKINGTSVNSGEASGSISLQVGKNPISILVIAENGRQKSYLVFVNRAATPLYPSRPQSFQAVGGNKQVDLSWQAPENSGGSSITGYTLKYFNGTSWVNATGCTSLGAAALSCTHTGLLSKYRVLGTKCKPATPVAQACGQACKRPPQMLHPACLRLHWLLLPMMGGPST